MADETDTGDEKSPFKRLNAHNFDERYANNVFFESSFWDLKLIFGLLDLTTKGNPTHIHTAMHIPWVQAKMCIYVMLVNVLMQERFDKDNKIKVPKGLIPTPLESALPELAKTPNGAEMVRVLQTVHECLFGKDAAKTEEAPPPE